MKAALVALIVLAAAGSASAAKSVIPPGCLSHPGVPGCTKYSQTVPAGATNNITNNTAVTISKQIANMTPPATVVGPHGRISVTTKVTAVRTARNVGQVGGVRTTYMQLWNRALSSKPIGYSIVTCFSIGSGGILGKGTVEECHSYYAMPRGKILAAGTSFSRRSYWLVIVGGTGLYAHGAGWAHYDHGRLVITFQ